MNIDELLQIVDDLSPDEFQRLKAHIAKRKSEEKPRTYEEWQAKIETALDKFWGDSTEEEMEALFEAIRTKNPSSEKGI